MRIVGKTRLSDEEFEEVDELLSRGDTYVEAVLDAFYERKRLRKRRRSTYRST